MRFLDLLAKLGILRHGATAATYTTATERPIEFQMPDVLNAKRDITTVEDVKELFGKKPPDKSVH